MFIEQIWKTMPIHIPNIHWENENAILPKCVHVQIAKERLLYLIQLKSLKACPGREEWHENMTMTA